MTMFVPAIPQNDHIQKLADFFGGLKSAPTKIPEGMNFVFLCYTNRCGSNFIAELFASSGKFNLAGEDLNFDTVINNSTQQKLESFQEYFSFLLRRKAKSGVFFLKNGTCHIWNTQ